MFQKQLAGGNIINILSAMQSVPKGERIFRTLLVKCELAFGNYLLIMFEEK
jgi:hypothetical protein